MIVIGYQGIGKSTLANEDIRFIDLESGNFWNNGKRPDDWYIYYCNIARHISNQGKIVFVSSHKEVRDNLRDYDDVIIVCPSLSLKDKWIKKLETRYNITKLEKDYKAYINAKNNYEENINSLKESGYNCIELTSLSYNLKEIILDNQKINRILRKDNLDIYERF